MTHEDAHHIYESINDSTRDDDALQSLKRELWTLAIRYARLRTDWRMASTDERRAMDVARSRAHDALIAQCDILSRAARKMGHDDTWRRALTDDRKEIGDFACHVHAILGVLAR